MPHYKYTAQASIHFVTYGYSQDGVCRRELGSYTMRSEPMTDSKSNAEDQLSGSLAMAQKEYGFFYNPAPHHGPQKVFIPWHQVYAISFLETLKEQIMGVL